MPSKPPFLDTRVRKVTTDEATRQPPASTPLRARRRAAEQECRRTRLELASGTREHLENTSSRTQPQVDTPLRVWRGGDRDVGNGFRPALVEGPSS